jgi:ubiquinone/menaquinone biosynthesis C-methylase UbiE
MTEARSGGSESFGLTLEAAEAYEATFVARLFGDWTPFIVDAAQIAPGQRVLDVACGTGVVAREVADRFGPDVTVVGVDLNEAMLTVARRLRPDIEWRQGDVAALPFPDSSFDVVLCQAGLMFFPDARQALSEMARVVTPPGVVAVQVWDRMEAQIGYVPFAEVAARHAGPEAMDLIGTYFTLGDVDALRALFATSGLEVAAVHTYSTRMRFESVDEFVMTEVEATPLAGRLDDDAYRRIREDSREALSQFREGDGVAIPVSGHVVSARRSRSEGSRFDS